MSWPFDTSDPLVIPERMAEDRRLKLGLSPEEWALPPTLLVTFQGEAHGRFLDRTLPHRPVAWPPSIGTVDGAPVAFARLSIGAPAAVIALEETIARGVRNILVVGSAGSLQPDLPIGSTVLVTAAEREDGTSHHYLPVGETVSADPGLTALLDLHLRRRGLSPVRGRSWTIDAPYRETIGAIRRHRESGVLVVEMEAAAIFAVARVRGVAAALVVTVSDELFGSEWNRGFEHDAYIGGLSASADAALDTAAALT